MASKREPSKRDLENFAKRAHAIDAIRGAEVGISVLANNENWGNERTVAVHERLAHMVRTTFKPNSKGDRLVLVEGKGQIDATAAAIYQMDEELSAKRKAEALERAKAAQAPMPAEIAAVAQGEVAIEDADPAALAAAEALAEQYAQ